MKKYRSNQYVTAGKVTKATREENGDLFIAIEGGKLKKASTIVSLKLHVSSSDLGYIVEHEHHYTTWLPTETFKRMYVLVDD